MPTEAELRERFHHDDEPATGVGIDLDAVLRRSRTRRRPRVVALAVVSSLAAVGIVVPLSIGVLGPQLGSTFGSSAGSAASAPGGNTAPEFATQGGGATGGVGGAPAAAATLNRCGAHLATPAPAADGLVVTVTPVSAAASARDIPVTVTLTNTGSAEVTGSLSPFPAITLSQQGTVLWHSNGAVPQLAQEIDLAPGASTTFSTTFEPLVCAAADDSGPSFPAHLPQAAAGTYQLSAAIDVSTDAGAVLVSGPTASATLH
jgi:hypothetical protein